MNTDYYRRIWHKIHKKSADVERGEVYHSFFCAWLRSAVSTLPCPACRRHAIDYINRYPPESTKDLFYWGWLFHNSVNGRLDKGYYDYGQARRDYGL